MLKLWLIIICYLITLGFPLHMQSTATTNWINKDRNAWIGYHPEC